MTLLALGSVKGSPGVTTTMVALAAVWPQGREVVLVEADPDGGDVAARAGLRLEPGLSTLAAAGRHALAADDLARHTQTLPGGIPTVLAPSDPQDATRALDLVAQRLPEALAFRDALVDVGRLRDGSPALPVVEAADTVVLVARPRVDDLQHVAPRAHALRRSGANVSVLLIGERPYPPEEVRSALGLPVVGPVADDPDTADVLCGIGRDLSRLLRSSLLRSCRSVVDLLLGDSGPATPVGHRADDVGGWERAVRASRVPRLDQEVTP